MANEVDESPWDLRQIHISLAKQSLEEVIKTRETEYDKSQPATQFPIRTFSDEIDDAITRVQRHANIGSGEVERLVLKQGIAVIDVRYGDQIERLAKLRDEIFDGADKLLINKFRRGEKFEFCELVLGVDLQSISLRPWESGAIKDHIVKPLHMCMATAIQLTMVAGLSRGDAWLRPWIKDYKEELEHFQQYLTRRLEPLARLTKG
jgi:hypothetical protein